MDLNKNFKLTSFFGASLSQLNSHDSNFSNVLESDVPLWIKLTTKVLLKKGKSFNFDSINELILIFL